VNAQLAVTGGAAYNLIVNPWYYYDENGGKYKDEWVDYYLHNFSFQLGVKYRVGADKALGRAAQ
jgi:hypothetical protein